MYVCICIRYDIGSADHNALFNNLEILIKKKRKSQIKLSMNYHLNIIINTLICKHDIYDI